MCQASRDTLRKDGGSCHSQEKGRCRQHQHEDHQFQGLAALEVFESTSETPADLIVRAVACVEVGLATLRVTLRTGSVLERTHTALTKPST